MQPIMPIDHLPDWDRRLARQDAFWSRAILDRPVVLMTLPRTEGRMAWPAAKTWPDLRARWMDAEYLATCARVNTHNTLYLGDALPTACPNLGPEVLSAFMGSPLGFGEQTSWSVPHLHDWAEADRAIAFREDNEYWQAMARLTDALLAAGQGRFYVGLTDYHPGGDAVAAFRDPMQFNIDLLESPEQVKRLLRRVTAIYFDLFDRMWARLQAAHQATTCWAGICSSRKWYVPSNDFSCMISKAMFDEFFLPGIAEECRFYGRSIYHLDGPGALQHLPSLLAIPELNAIQWVYGSGHGRATDWLHVYKQCQAAGKGIQLHSGLDELETLCRELRPEGVWLTVGGVPDAVTAQAVIKRVSQWR